MSEQGKAMMLSSSLGVEFFPHGGCVLVDYAEDGEGEEFELTLQELSGLTAAWTQYVVDQGGQVGLTAARKEAGRDEQGWG